MPVRHIARSGLTHTTYGLIGEHIAAASILAQGWRVAMAQMDGVDLVAWNIDTMERLLIQVKSGQASIHGRRKVQFQTAMGGIKQPNGTKRKRLPTSVDFDILALVSSEQRAVFFMSVTEIKQQKITKSVDFFENPNLETESWKASVEQFNETNTQQTTLRNIKHRSRSSRNS